MIYFPKTRGQVSQEFPVASGSTIAAEGQAVIADTTLGVFGCKPSAGSSGELFLGIAVAEQIAITSFPKVEEFTVGAGLTYVLARTPQGSTTAVYNVTDSAVVTAGGGASQYSLSGKTLTLGASLNGKVLRVWYRYAPTTVEAQAIQGDIRPGGAAALLLNQVGVIQKGVVYTSEYDTSVDWLQANPTVKLGANGRFTIGGSGATVNGVVVAAPNASGPDGAFLGLEINAI